MDQSDLPVPETGMDELVHMFDCPLLYLIYGSRENRGVAPACDDLDMLCLRSFLFACRRVGPAARVLFLDDGTISSEQRGMMEQYGTMVPVTGRSRGAVRRTALRAARSFPSDALVYFATGDRVYHESAFERLLDTFALLPEAEYVTLDGEAGEESRSVARLFVDLHSGRSTPPRRLRENDPFVPDLADRPFAEFESTGAEFGARVDRLRHDGWVHYLGSIFREEWVGEIWTIIREVARVRGERRPPILAGPSLPLAARLGPAMEKESDLCGVRGMMPGMG